MGHAHTSADKDVVPHDLILLDDGDEADVVGKDIDGIVGWDGYGNLEFTG